MTMYCSICKKMIDTTAEGKCPDCGRDRLYQSRSTHDLNAVVLEKHEPVNTPTRPIDVINPSHYREGEIEVIDAIDDWKLGFCLGNAVKYIARAGKKDSSKVVEDLRKAIWYIERSIKKITEWEDKNNSCPK